MSHPLNNPYSSGNQISTQVQSGHFTMRDPRGGSGPSLGSTGASCGTSSSSGERFSSVLPHPVSDRPHQSAPTLDYSDIERSVDLHISRAREAVKLLSKPAQQTKDQPAGQGSHLTNTQRDDSLSSGTGMTSYATSSTSASCGHFTQLNEDTGSRSLEWMSDYQRSTADDSHHFYSSRYTGGTDCNLNYTTEVESRKPSIPGLGDLDYPLPDGPSTPVQPSQPKFTSQSAASILWRFGLEKEDLEQLISFPEDQITPDNLPFILRQIRNAKARKATTAAEDLQRRGASVSNSVSSSGGIGMQQQDAASTIHQPTKVIDYGHMSKYSGGIEDEIDVVIKRARASSDRSGSVDSGKHGQDRLPEHSTRSSSASRDQASPFSALAASWSSILNSSSNYDPTKQALRPELSSTSPHGSKSIPLRDQEADHQAMSTCASFPVILSQPGHAVSSGNKDGGSKGQSKGQGQEQWKEQKTSPPVCSGNAAVSETPRVTQPAVFIPSDLQTLVNYISMKRLPSVWQPSANIAVFKGLPSLAMMYDYAAASPAAFPHTCSLCNTEFTYMKDWISHQNDGHHLQRCKLLRQQYPDWNGEITEESNPAKDAQPSSSISSKSSKRRRKKTKHASPSRLRSPGSCCHHDSENKKKKKKRKSRSRSPHGSGHTHRSRSHSGSPRYDHPTSSSSSSHRRRSLSRSHERRSPRSRTRSNSAERLAKKLLETSAVQSQSGLEDVVKTLAMTLAKINTSSSSSSKGGKRSLSPPSPRRKKLSPPSPRRKKPSPPSPRRKKLSSSVSSSVSSFSAKKKEIKVKPSFQENEKVSYINMKAGRSAPLAPTMVKLHGILDALSHVDVVDAMERFGKTKSVVLFRTKQEALVCFEREQDAKELKSYKTLNVKGFLVTIVRHDGFQEQNKLHQKLSNVPAAVPNMSPLIQHIQKHLHLPKPAETRAPDESANAPAAVKKPKKIAKTLRTLRRKYLKGSDSDEAESVKAAVEEKPNNMPETPKTLQEESTSDAAGRLTAGELLHQHLNPSMICCKKMKNCLTEKFAQAKLKLLMIKNLPVYGDGCYTEEDLARLLSKFGFEHKEDSMFVVPQTCMAFVTMPTTEKLQKMLVFCSRKPLWFRGCQLELQVVAAGISMTLLGFYKSLMKVVKVRVTDQGVRTIYVSNISPRETRRLREALTKIGCVKNFLPLLNKVYVEFETIRDADRLGVWYSWLDPVPRYQIVRLKTPNNYPPLPPKLPEQALPENGEAVTGATVMMMGGAVPHGSFAPFWITLKTSPFVFPTVSPWFNHPEHLTISGKSDVEKAGLMEPTPPSVIMMTGLPEGNYKQKDVSKLVWPYFSKQDVYSMYYHVTVLPLQRRAFVYFSDWEKCCEFVNGHLTNPVCVQGCKLTLHFLLHCAYPKYSEDLMYRTLMEWSNIPVAEPDTLEKRLLSAEIFYTTVDVVRQVMEVVTAIAPVVGFLPLANRICIEMADAKGAAKVLEEYHYYQPSNTKQSLNWNLVGDIASAKSFKKHLQDSSEMRIVLNAGPTFAAVPNQDDGPQPADVPAGAAGFTTSKPQTAPSATTAGKTDKVKQEESEIPMETDEDPEVERRRESPASLSTEINSGNTSAAGSKPSAAPVPSAGMETQLPLMNEDVFRVLTAAVRQHRLTRENRSQNKSWDEEGQTLTQDDFTSDNVSSDAYMFEGQEFNMEDFVTVDEVGDVEDANSKSLPVSSRRPSADVPRQSKTSFRPTREDEDEGVSSTTRQVFAETSRDSSSPSSSSKDTKSRQSSPACSSTSAAADMPKTRTGSVEALKEAGTHPESLREATDTQGLEGLNQTQKPLTQRDPHGKSSPSSSLEPGPDEKIHLKKSAAEIMEEDEDERFHVLDSFDERRDDGVQNGSSELQRTGPQESRTSIAFQILDSVDDEEKTSRENGNEMETEGCFQVVDSVSEDQETADQEETRLRDEIPASAESARGVSRTSDEIQPPEDAGKECDWAMDEEGAFEIVDSIDDQTVSEDESQKPFTGTPETPGDDEEPKNEDEGPSVPSKESSKSEETSPKTAQKCEMQTEDSVRGVQTPDKDVMEDIVYEIIDSVEEEEVQDAAKPTKESGRRRSTRRKNEDKMRNQSKIPEKVDEDEEATYEVLDSMEDEGVTRRRSLRGRRGRSKKELLMETIKTSLKEDVSTRRRQTPSRASKERNVDKTAKKEVTRKEKSGKDEEEGATYQILDSVEDEVGKDDPSPTETTGRKRRRKDEHTDKPVKNMKCVEEEEEEEEEEPVYQIVDSLEDDQIQENLLTTDRGRAERGETEDKVPLKEEAPETRTSAAAVEASGKAVVKETSGRPSAAKRTEADLPERDRRTDASAPMNLDNAAHEEEAARDVSREEPGREEPGRETDRDIAVEEEESNRQEPRPPGQEDQSVDSLNPETLMTVDAVCIDEEEKLDEGGSTSKTAEHKRGDEKVASKRKIDVVGPRAKRSHARSPTVPVDFKLPPFRPNNPLGLEFVVPQWGFFCHVCSEFCMAKTTTKELHCSSQTHYDNLEKHYQKLQQTSSTSPAQSSSD